jgi:KipI family sensor histidine kinase inhibitor
MNRSVPVGEVRNLGDRALVVGVEDPSAGRQLARRLHGDWSEEAVEVVVGFGSVMLWLADQRLELDDVRVVVDDALRSGATSRETTRRRGDIGDIDGIDEFESLDGIDDVESRDASDQSTSGRTFTVPCAFDGPDLDDVAAWAGCTPDDVVGLLTRRPLAVAVMGFSPGFAYLNGLPDALRDVPRRDSPRVAVPAGSVALANGHAAIYPLPSPGGWQLVGRTGFALFSLSGPPYATLGPGDAVQLSLAGEGDALEPAPLSLGPWSPPLGSRRVLRVEAPGWRAVLQDGGRRGVAAIGVPAAGPADPVSHALANRLVGNIDGSGALEVTAGGMRLQAIGACHVAVVGDAVDVLVETTPVPSGQVLPIAAGQVLDIGVFSGGMRCYLAVAGGLLGPRAFASCASDELSGIGGGGLKPGQVLHAGAWSPPLGDHLAPGSWPRIEPRDSGVTVRVVPGPHPESFHPDALERLARTRFVVGDDSNRVGLRLRVEDGRSMSVRLDRAELDSQGVVTGAVQVPPGGGPVVLMPDHATLGGYPVVAVVAAVDHALLGQCRPGTVVRFVPVSYDEAVAARLAARRRLDHAVLGHYPLSTG